MARFVPEALAFLDALDRTLSDAILVGSAHPFLNALDVIETERARIRGKEHGWPTQLWFSYRIGLVVLEDRLHDMLSTFPGAPDASKKAPVVEVFTWIRGLRPEIEALEGGTTVQ